MAASSTLAPTAGSPSSFEPAATTRTSRDDSSLVSPTPFAILSRSIPMDHLGRDLITTYFHAQDATRSTRYVAISRCQRASRLPQVPATTTSRFILKAPVAELPPFPNLHHDPTPQMRRDHTARTEIPTCLHWLFRATQGPPSPEKISSCIRCAPNLPHHLPWRSHLLPWFPPNTPLAPDHHETPRRMDRA